MGDLNLTGSAIPGLPHSCEIVLTGAISSGNAQRLQERLQKSLASRDTIVILAMKDVTYVNSSGFGTFIDLAMDLERRGGILVLVEVQPKVKLVFENLGIARYFHFEPTVAPAREFAAAHAKKAASSPRVVILDGSDEGAEYPVVGASIRVGSDPKSTIVVRHPHVEPRHAEIYRTGDRCFVRDLGTRHGTAVGDRKVNDEPLSPGDVVRIGNCRMVFVPPGARKSGVHKLPSGK